MSDIVAHLNMDLFPSVGLVVFLGVFVLVAYRAVGLKRSAAEHASRLPLDDEPPAPGASA